MSRNCIVWERGPNRAEMTLRDLADCGEINSVGVIIAIAEEELRVPPQGSPIDGAVPGRDGVWWRRCIRVEDATRDPRIQPDEDDRSDDPWNYVMIYRECDPLDNVERRPGESGCFRVTHILQNRYLVGAFKLT